jgi:hypothetical protein
MSHILKLQRGHHIEEVAPLQAGTPGVTESTLLWAELALVTGRMTGGQVLVISLSSVVLVSSQGMTLTASLDTSR